MPRPAGMRRAHSGSRAGTSDCWGGTSGRPGNPSPRSGAALPPGHAADPPRPEVPGSHGSPKKSCHVGHVFISSSAQADQDRGVLRPAAGVTEYPGESVRCLKSGDDSFEPADTLKCIQRLIIGGRLVAHPPTVLEPAVFGTNTRVIEPGGDGVSRQDLS